MNIRRTSSLILALALLAPGVGVGGAQTSTRIVDWGHDLGVGWYRETTQKTTGTRGSFPAEDLDDDGTTSDDALDGWPFSLEDPLSPMTTRYDRTMPNNIFYGGAVVGVSDIAGNSSRSPSEGHINQNHELRDDWNLMAMPSVQKQPELEKYKAAGLWLWKKEHFLNGADEAQVSFRAGDYIAVFISRYYGGLDWSRWVVNDGGQFYVSERTFGDEQVNYYYEEGLETDGARNPIVRRSHVIEPSATRWAPYNPQAPGDIFFDQSAANWADREFSDVQMVGFLVHRDLSEGKPAARPLSLKEPIALKFNALQAVATVDRPETWSHVEMAEVRNGLHSATAPTSFADWLEIWKWAVTNQRARNFPEGMENRDIGGYTFLRNGIPNAAETGAVAAVTRDEPVTMITWWDAAAWCNAMSEMENREPVYYTDAAFTEPLRAIADRTKLERFDLRPAIFWKTDATGYRLPTAAEYAQVSAGNPAPAGFFEYLWPGESNQVAADVNRFPAAGQGIAPAATAVPFGVEPFAQGAPVLGFRVMRGPGQPSALSGSEWMITEGQRLPSSNPLTTAALQEMVQQNYPFVLVEGAGSLPVNEDYRKVYAAEPVNTGDLNVAGSEVPYALWNAVKHWAMAEGGYRFNHAGDPGSLRYKLPGTEQDAYQLDEPVTHLTWLDAVVWCNALSELMELSPVYRDRKTGEPLRYSTPLRIEMYPEYHYTNEGRDTTREVDTAAIIDVKTDTTKPGFRLPTRAEMDAVYVGITEESRPAALKTRPVTEGVEHNGIFGLRGNVAEWTYGGDPLFGQWVWGSDFGYPDGLLPHQMNSKEHVFAARSYIGFRPVRGASNGTDVSQ